MKGTCDLRYERSFGDITGIVAVIIRNCVLLVTLQGESYTDVHLRGGYRLFFDISSVVLPGLFRATHNL
ncbi:NADH-ubiquinone/plastoquinone oxidoreductase family domain protein [Anaplasma phagocytophilum str. ApNP]|uniref:NADH-ubiquinone/plastoquinone oxidoreductase family domain protein n=1 Tax=Anaplasma phagocytophilum str. ApNP TaxID=1359153 RepID=A0A0F3NF99_ANAPH|nr:NADH-ubiquinone/plastoquinone oxidoreductase family domain protein [Anaplasma phagocytophilum str. ApNP]